MLRRLAFLSSYAAVVLAVMTHVSPARAAPPDSIAAASYRVYTAAGESASLEDVVAAMARVDVVFVGEQHGDSVAHGLQAALLERAHARHGARGRRTVVLSLEMFEQDVQLALDEYLEGLITEEHFLRSSRPWPNYLTDYRPMVVYARQHRLPVLAANAPRRYVNLVARRGRGPLRGLPEASKEFLPPLPYGEPSAAYRAKWDRLMQEAAHPTTVPPPPQAAASEGTHGAPSRNASAAGDGGDARPSPPTADERGVSSRETARPGRPSPAYLLDAQTLWDASMGYSIARQLMRDPGALVLHLTGAFHVEGGLGTPAHLARYRPGTRMLIVVMRPAADVTSFDPNRHEGLGDFVILTSAP